MGLALWEEAWRAVEAARAAAGLLRPGPVLWRRSPRGVAADVVVLYRGAAVDRMHFDPYRLVPLPKGLPEPPAAGGAPAGEEEVVAAAGEVIRGLEVLAGAEYRGPERAWAVPLAWRGLIVVHLRVRVRGDGGVEVVPDEPLMVEAARLLGRL